MCQIAYLIAETCPATGVHAFRNQHPGDIFTGGHKLQAHTRVSTYFVPKMFSGLT